MHNWPLEQALFYIPVTGGILLFICTKMYWTEVKVLIVSRKSDFKFDKPFLDKVFCRTLERVLSSAYVAQELKHLLRTGVSDEESIFEVTKASAAEKEHGVVQSKGEKTLHVNTVQEETNNELLKAAETLSINCISGRG